MRFIIAAVALATDVLALLLWTQRQSAHDFGIKIKVPYSQPSIALIWMLRSMLCMVHLVYGKVLASEEDLLCSNASPNFQGDEMFSDTSVTAVDAWRQPSRAAVNTNFTGSS